MVWAQSALPAKGRANLVRVARDTTTAWIKLPSYCCSQAIKVWYSGKPRLPTLTGKFGARRRPDHQSTERSFSSLNSFRLTLQ